MLEVTAIVFLSSLGVKKKRIVTDSCIVLINSDNSIEEQPVKELVRKYIRCSSRLTIAQVKKFLKVKLNLKTADQVSACHTHKAKAQR